MGSLLRGAGQLGRALLLASALSTVVSALDIDICASFNTADMSRNISIYQTNGLCHDFCLQKNQAYAITQANGCWCSDYTPAKSVQVSKGNCDTHCPAFPAEYCGGDGVFGYIALNNVLPSGTRGGSDPTSTSSTSKAEIPTATTWVTKTVQDTATSSLPSSSSSPTTTSSSSSTLSSTDGSSDTPTPTTSMVQTVTAGGTVRTVTVLPTQTGGTGGDASNERTGSSVQKSGLSTGAVAGIAVGVVLAVIAVAGTALFFWLRRRRQNRDDYQDDPSVRGSSSGMTDGRPEMSGAPGSPGSAGNRSSMLQVDPRMDPFKQGLYARNGSHESVNTLRDDHDYSRRIQQPKVLRAMNPDPE